MGQAAKRKLAIPSGYNIAVRLEAFSSAACPIKFLFI
jgi:hypothetical protein